MRWQHTVLFLSMAWTNPAAAQTAAKPAARVNGEDVPLAEFQAVVDLRPSPVPVSKELQREMRQAAVDMLIDDLLMRQFLRRNVAPVNPVDLQKEYDKLHEALKKQNKTIDHFLLEGKMTAEQLRADIIARLQWKAYLQGRFPEAEIKSYYEANKVFFDNVLVRASHILVKFNKNPTAEDKQKAKAKIDTIRQEIAAGKVTFEDAARKYSDCPSREKGGDIGNFPYKFIVVEPLAQAAFAAKKGELTDVVGTELGYHLLKVTDRTAGVPSRFEDSRDAIRDVMAQEAELYQRILGEQRKTATIEVLVE
ncbi:MAG: peptidylprolyl isomerase [Gemmataceae bacterium]|nr:peptidylprolyl isomerase [Gemmataceae bacterium]